jgi:hypothetical protein
MATLTYLKKKKERKKEKKKHRLDTQKRHA